MQLPVPVLGRRGGGGAGRQPDLHRHRRVRAAVLPRRHVRQQARRLRVQVLQASGGEEADLSELIRGLDSLNSVHACVCV